MKPFQEAKLNLQQVRRPMLPLIFGVLLLSGGSAYAGWEAVAVSDTGMTVYFDRSTIHRDTYVVTMSVLHDYQVPENISSGSFLSFTSEQQYDCGVVRSRTIKAVVFSEHMGNGRVLYSGTGDDTWQSVTPMTIDHALWRTACPDGKSTEVARLFSDELFNVSRFYTKNGPLNTSRRPFGG